ncbi:DDE superfamily endonuclease [Popillia japonica]|uniref:DDE superfamily endonuclease n=1 Tax=Popillia japonica TaxID=7064 RepID=A0AAW1MGH9_POPJA
MKVVFLPANVKHVQPMDQGIIKNLKHFYRSLLVGNILSGGGNETCPADGSRDHQKLETLLQKFVGGKYSVRRWKRSKNKAGYSASLPNVQTSMGQSETRNHKSTGAKCSLRHEPRTRT